MSRLARWLLAVVAINVTAFFFSRALLAGPDPEASWKFVPGLVWYVTLPVIVALAVALLVEKLVRAPRSR
jgi:hypothetical protein